MAEFDVATLSSQPNAASVPTFTYPTVPSNVSNVIDYFPDYDIKKLSLSRRQVFLVKHEI